ncbi:MAG: MFS transporter [Candidatus Nealsonbacteria bacterium]|nr:MFS transporter [Candidatus Nealsonbacteria bacterium]
MKSQLFFLYLASFITLAGFSMVFPLLPFYAQTFGATNAQIGLLAASFSIAQFISAPIIGRLSDRFGRKPILAISLAGSAVSFLIFGLSPSLAWLFLARTMHGIFSAGAFPIAAAYIGDVTSKENRVKYMGRLTATQSLGFIVGPAASGLLSGVSINLPFFAASAVSLINSLFIIFWLSESLTKKTEKLAIKEGLINLKAVVNGLRGEFGTLFFLLSGWAFAISNMQVAFPLFAEEKFAFTGVQNGFVFAFMGTLGAIVQWVLLPKAVKIIGEHKTAAIGVFIMAAGQFLIPTAPSVIFLTAFILTSSLGGSLFRPTINAILSKEAKEGQGATMGMAFSFESLGRVMGPLAAAILLTTLGIQSQFVLTSSILIIGVLLFLKATTKVHKKLA